MRSSDLRRSHFDWSDRIIGWRTDGEYWFGKLPYDRLKNGFIAGSPAMPGILDGQNFIPYESAFSYHDMGFTVGLQQWHADTQRLAAQWRSQHGSDVVAELPGTWCFLAQPWSNVFWHWMCEALVKIAAFEASGFGGGYIVPVGAEFVRQSLDLLKIDPDRIYYCAAPYARIEHLIIPRKFRAQFDLKDYLDALDWLRRRLIPDQVVDPELKIYVARRGGRTIINEEDLLSLLSRHGFRIFHMEDLNLREQIALISRASFFSGPHGSGFAHTMLMPRRSHIVEIFSPYYVNPCMLPSVKHLDQDYSMIVGYTITAPGTSRDDPILANIELVSLALERAEKLDRFHHVNAQS